MRLAFLLLVFGAPASLGPWEMLAEFRRNLAGASPLTARFDQTFTPEGFTLGETESGRLALSLPDCLRWDYDDPYPKAFILCGDVVHYWNPGEDEGYRELIDAEREPGLDLLLLDVEELRSRYRVEGSTGEEGRVRIRLVPLAANENLVEATLELDSTLKRLLELRYVDIEGNRTSFSISGYQPGIVNGTFNPPEDISWVDQ